MSAVFDRVAVLGLGLIGGSLMNAIRHGGLDVVGFDTDPATMDAASASGYPVAPTDVAAVRGADLVILAMPLPQVRWALNSIAHALGQDTILTDVGTLKQPVHAAVREIAPRGRFVGGHPLAGTEESGWAAGDPLLFRDAPWSLSLEPDTDVPSWLKLAELVCDLGGRPVPTTAADQDAAVARVIGLPHVLAEALALTGLAGGPLGLSLAAGSYMSGSRVARTRAELVATWCDGNDALVGALDDVIDRLRGARESMAAGGSVLDLARAGHDARINWERRRFGPVELRPDADELRAHGRRGGWITAVLRDRPDDTRATALQRCDGVRLLGMAPTE